MTRLDMSFADIQAKVILYYINLSERLKYDNFQLKPNNDNVFFLLDLEDLDNNRVIPRNGDEHAIDVDDVIPQDDPTEEAFDTLLNAEVSINVGDKHTLGTVTKRARGADGSPSVDGTIIHFSTPVCMRFRFQTDPLVNSHIT